jgi:hypothetical protein
MNVWIILIFLFSHLYAETVPEKVLICGIGKNIQNNIHNVMQSATRLGEHFLDYRIIIYENNSDDKSRRFLSRQAYRNPNLIFVSEYLEKKELAEQFQMKVHNRTEAIARARNKVLDIAMQKEYNDYKYVVWVDLDLSDPWDVDNILDTILYPEQEWDAVLANGAYDLFALRDPEFPIGFELIGNIFFDRLDEMRARFILDPNGPWRRVYSAFGGLGIYKRNAIKNCRYSGVVTKELETVALMWLERAKNEEDVYLLDNYLQLLSTAPIIDLYKERLIKRKRYPDPIGLRLHKNGLGKIVWFSCTKNHTLPWTCEHVNFHASMILRGRDKIFINPRLISNWR